MTPIPPTARLYRAWHVWTAPDAIGPVGYAQKGSRGCVSMWHGLDRHTTAAEALREVKRWVDHVIARDGELERQERDAAFVAACRLALCGRMRVRMPVMRRSLVRALERAQTMRGD